MLHTEYSATEKREDILGRAGYNIVKAILCLADLSAGATHAVASSKIHLGIWRTIGPHGRLPPCHAKPLINTLILS